jgi:hypothetical protein
MFAVISWMTRLLRRSIPPRGPATPSRSPVLRLESLSERVLPSVTPMSVSLTVTPQGPHTFALSATVATAPALSTSLSPIPIANEGVTILGVSPPMKTTTGSVSMTADILASTPAGSTVLPAEWGGNAISVTGTITAEAKLHNLLETEGLTFLAGKLSVTASTAPLIWPGMQMLLPPKVAERDFADDARRLVADWLAEVGHAVTGLGSESREATPSGPQAEDGTRENAEDTAASLSVTRIEEQERMPLLYRSRESDPVDSLFVEEGDMMIPALDGETNPLVRSDWMLPEAREKLEPLNSADGALVPAFTVENQSGSPSVVTPDHPDAALHRFVIGQEEATTTLPRETSIKAPTPTPVASPDAPDLPADSLVGDPSDAGHTMEGDAAGGE